MNIVQPYARLINFESNCRYYGPLLTAGGGSPMIPFTEDNGRALLRRIEFCARISHRSEEAQTEGSWDRFIRAVVIGHGDWSVVEHASVSVDMLVDRGITHELVRHRLFSFTQESTRFVNYEKKMPPSFIEPPFAGKDPDIEQKDWSRAIHQCEHIYAALVADGVSPQIARSVFPNALASRIIMTGNLRNFRHLLLMRTTKEAHPQMKQVMIPLLAEFKAKIPILFEDIEPNARQIDNMRLTR
jgi:thymidylate synthase (FAD)